MIPINKPKNEITIVVAMSGGVDSSVVAALLKEEGYNVIGITLQLYNTTTINANSKTCCGVRDICDAREVAAQINIPHYVINKESAFKEEVIDKFADDYLSGITPVPCIRCNQKVKFIDLLQMAKKLGADALATGHYVKKIINENNKSELHRPRDLSKDQTYFLFGTTQEQLDFLAFPLGDMEKSTVRDLAKKFNLVVSGKKDSQDICFVPNGDYVSVVQKIRPGTLEAGYIIHIKTNKILGNHNGLIGYTIGQRRGINISYENPLYVVKMDFDKHILYVGEEENLYSNEFEINEVNILDDCMFNEDIDIEVCTRALKETVPAKLSLQENGNIKIKLLKTERAITKGQACVIYYNSRVLGGGFIVKSKDDLYLKT